MSACVRALTHAWAAVCAQALDAEGLPLLVTSICGTGSEQKVYARKVGSNPDPLCPDPT